MQIITREAAESIRELWSCQQPKMHLGEGDSRESHTRSLSEVLALSRLHSPSRKVYHVLFIVLCPGSNFIVYFLSNLESPFV